MKLIEEIGDLFEVSNEKEYNSYMLAHCISSDFGMSAGIVLEFNRRYDMKTILTKNYMSNGLVPQCIKVYNVYNLVTKKNYWNKPTYDTLEGSLRLMKEDIVLNNIHKLAIPLIGCGIDGLNWEKVRKILEEVFEDLDIEIRVRIKK